jgi:hypothetical protein
LASTPPKPARAITAILDGEPDNAFTVEDLCDRIYPEAILVEMKHRVAVLRAAGKLMSRRAATRHGW